MRLGELLREVPGLEKRFVYYLEAQGVIRPTRLPKQRIDRREYSEEETWERRYRLGFSAAKRLEEEEKAAAPTVVHPIPAEFRGIGIRIEDDVLVTAGGCEVLTAATPKTPEEVERTCAEPPRLPYW